MPKKAVKRNRRKTARLRAKMKRKHAKKKMSVTGHKSRKRS